VDLTGTGRTDRGPRALGVTLLDRTRSPTREYYTVTSTPR